MTTADTTTGPAGDTDIGTAADTTTGPVPGTTTPAGSGDSGSGPPRPDRTERRGWYAVGALTGLVALTWLPRLDTPFGDDHLGRIIGRYALHLRNLQEHGVLGSHFGADWAPYASAPYAHHPPLMNLLTALTGLLPGDGEYQVWLPPYLLALLIIPAGAALLRGLGIRWSATLLALGLTVATTFYWVHSPLMIDLGPILALSAGIVRLRRQPDPSRRLVAVTCLAALLSTLVSWPGIALAGVLGIWLVLGRRRLDRAVLLVGAAMLVGVAVSLVFVVGVTGLALLGGQAELRSSGGFTVRQFLRRQWQYARDLLPVWYLVLLPLGGLVALLDRRTRGYLVIAAGFTAGWILGLNNGAFVHSYWSYPILVVGLVGTGVLLDRLATGFAAPVAARRTVLAVAGVGLLAYLGVLALSPFGQRLVTEPARAGRLVADHRPPADQRYAWVVGSGLNSPRWLAYYWNLTPRLLTVEELTAETTRPDELVLVDLNRRPNWIPESVGGAAVARDGRYALVPVAALRATAVRP
ncbi:hypothetical protein [Plantactinospora sonchi]|uniref:Glycosyltransferase RgtA/B/C/D-like domain-containing protein n=1 Tax=Plantactinospora sonchi TaxID=1544735 RepID=A0ABU7RV83_9ACTN